MAALSKRPAFHLPSLLFAEVLVIFCPVDAGEIFARGCGQAFFRFFGFIAALWIGTWIAGIALGMGQVVENPAWGWRFTISHLSFGPAMLLSKLFLLNLIVVIGGLAWFVRTERDLAWFWGSLVMVFSLLGVIGWISSFKFPIWSLVAVWISYLVVLTGVLSAIAFVVAWRRNRWAGEMAMLQAENVQRRAELESRGIATFDRETD